MRTNNRWISSLLAMVLGVAVGACSSDRDDEETYDQTASTYETQPPAESTTTDDHDITDPYATRNPSQPSDVTRDQDQLGESGSATAYERRKPTSSYDVYDSADPYAQRPDMQRPDMQQNMEQGMQHASGNAVAINLSALNEKTLKKLQLNLGEEGHFKGKVTGKADAKTKEALTAFQRSASLPDSGGLDRSTARELELDVFVEAQPVSGTDSSMSDDSDEESKTDTQSKSKTDTQSKSKTDTQSKSKTDTQPRSKTDTNATSNESDTDTMEDHESNY